MSRALATLLAEQARRTPDATALVDGDDRLSYRELHQRSAGLAEVLDVGPGDRVCLLLPKSAAAVVAMTAVLDRGAAYVPLDPAAPAARTARVIRDCDPAMIVADARQRDAAARVLAIADDPAPVCWFDGERASRPPRVGHRHVPADDLAYLIYTSGSTGTPKGVPISQDSVIHFARWVIDHFGIGPADRLSGHPAFHFDLSVLDLYAALLSGAALHLVPDRVSMLPDLLARFIRSHELTQWNSVPSALAAMTGRDVVRDFPSLRRVLWCGDVMPIAVLRHWMRQLPHVRFTNLYGPTEATVASAFHDVTEIPDASAPPLPIGAAVPGEALAVLDVHGRPLPPGEVGDLYISGRGLSPGYWRDPERTADAFREWPAGSGRRWYRTGDRARTDADGLLHFHGRTDRQVKSSGYRIELDDVAAAVARLTGVAQSAVVAVPVNGFEGRQICAAYVAAPGVAPRAAALRREFAALMPAYMMPARWQQFSSLPRTRNGKIDHRSIEKQFTVGCTEEEQ